jgi:hypothetical protein
MLLSPPARETKAVLPTSNNHKHCGLRRAAQVKRSNFDSG